MSVSVNEKAAFKDKNIGKLLDDGFTKNGFTAITREEFNRDLMKINPLFAKYFWKKSEGIEGGYHSHVNNFRIIVWPTYVPSRGKLKVHDQGWVIIIDPRNSEVFFSIPMNRFGDFIDRIINTARVYREVVLHWPVCKSCGKMFFWRVLFKGQANEPEESFPIRQILCLNPRCSEAGKHPMLVTDIQLPDKKDMKFFALPFERYQRYVKRNKKKGKETNSRRLLRWLTKMGIIFHLNVIGVYDSDTAYERGVKGTDEEGKYFEDPPEDLNYNE